jgi:hypothetical protein
MSSGWRKMESAPRDGSRIIIALPSHVVEDEDARVGVASFIEGHWRFSSGHTTGSIAADVPVGWRHKPKHPTHG